MPGKRSSFIANSFSLLKQTFSEWLEDQAPQLEPRSPITLCFRSPHSSFCYWQSLASFSTTIQPGLEKNDGTNELLFG